MNKVILIGNLTRDPELRQTRDGTPVCSFTVAVNRRRRGDAPQEADFFQVSAWRELGENCKKYLTKGKKVFVSGPVRASAYVGNDGEARARLEVQADDVEFLSPRETAAPGTGEYIPVPDEELPEEFLPERV